MKTNHYSPNLQSDLLFSFSTTCLLISRVKPSSESPYFLPRSHNSFSDGVGERDNGYLMLLVTVHSLSNLQHGGMKYLLVNGT